MKRVNVFIEYLSRIEYHNSIAAFPKCQLLGMFGRNTVYKLRRYARTASEAVEHGFPLSNNFSWQKKYPKVGKENRPIYTNGGVNDENIICFLKGPLMKSGNLVGGDAEHPASGIVKVDGNMVYLENVEITEAPDGRVILAKDFDERTGVRLGSLQGFTGSHQYPVPEGTNVNDFNTVLIWCDQFNVPIGKVKL